MVQLRVQTIIKMQRLPIYIYIDILIVQIF